MENSKCVNKWPISATASV